MRQPRGPRPPREPREPRATPEPVPPPGFSIPVAGAFRFGSAPGSGPRPASRAAAAPSAFAPPAEPAPAASDEGYSPPAGPAIAAAAANEFTARIKSSEPYRYRTPRQAPPQGETQLVHAWLHALTTLKVPPQACTIWVTSCEQPTYTLYIPGEAVVGEHPDRMLYEYVAANRRRKDVAERFVGRIKAPTLDGTPYECGGGELYLPPAVPAAAPPGWSAPAAPPGWSSPYGPPGALPWGAAPPWGGGWPGMPWGPAPMGMGMPPWWGPSGGPLSALLQAAHPQPPPPAVQSDPAALAMWKGMQDNQKAMFEAFVQMATRPPPAAAAPATADPLDQLVKLASVLEKFQTPQGPNSPITVTKLDEETSLVTDKNGDIHPTATAFANMKGLRGIAAALRPPRPGGAASGPQPARRQGQLPAPNGAAKPNGGGS